MKKNIITLLVLLIAAVSGAWAQTADNSPYAPNHQSPALNGPRRAAANVSTESLVSFSCTTGTQYGVCIVGEFIYTASWRDKDSNYSPDGFIFHKYDTDGNYIEAFNIDGLTKGIRDIAYDGEYIYGSTTNSTVYKIDIVNKTLVGTITIPISVRGLTYDPKRDGFWAIDNWSATMNLYDRNGNFIQSGKCPGSISGCAYYMDNEGEEHILMFYNTTSTENDDIFDYNITSDELLSQPIADYSQFSVDYNHSSAGGLFIGMYKNQICLFGDLQEDPNQIAICPITNAMTDDAFILSTGTNEHGSFICKVGEDEVTTAEEGDQVTVIIEPDEGWVPSKVTVRPYTTYADAHARRKLPAAGTTIDILQPFEVDVVESTVEENTVYSATFTMPKANAEVSVDYKKLLTNTDITIEPIADQTYNGKAIEPELIVKDGETVLVLGTDYELTYSNNTNAALATDENAPTVTVTAVTNSEKYAGTTAVTFTILKADIDDLTQPTAIEGLVYSAYDQELIVAGSTEEGTMLYSLDGEQWSEDVPMGNDEGVYIVYWKVTGFANYNDVAQQTLSVTIAESDFDAALDDLDAAIKHAIEVLALVGKDMGNIEIPLVRTIYEADDLYKLAIGGADVTSKQIVDMIKKLREAEKEFLADPDVNTEISTGISAVNAEADTDAWFDLSGRRLQGKPDKAGVYIVNGRKVAISRNSH
jgi:hypothetical protein